MRPFELSKTASPDLKFELGKRIEDCKLKIKEFKKKIKDLESSKELERCIVVDPMHRGDYPTITEAIRMANPGDKIIVRPGLYHEGIIIDKPLEIIGEGVPGEVIVESFGRDTLYFSGSVGRVINLTLRQMDEGEKYAVNIADGQLRLEECDITSKSLACVFIDNGADPYLCRNQIHDGRNYGVVIINGRGMLEDNEIFGHTRDGIVIVKTDKPNPILRRNRIYNNKEDGVYICDNGQGTLENNQIYGNGCSGVHITNGEGTVEDCDIFGNGKTGDYAEVSIEQEGNLVIKRCKIHDAQNSNCIWVDKEGKGTVEDCEIFGSKDPNVWITNGSIAVIRRCRIYGGHSQGIGAYKGSSVTVEECEVFENARAGVKIMNNSNLTLHRSHIYRNGHAAVWMQKASAGVIQNNDLRGNKEGPFAISPDSWLNVRKSDNQKD